MSKVTRRPVSKERLLDDDNYDPHQVAELESTAGTPVMEKIKELASKYIQYVLFGMVVFFVIFMLFRMVGDDSSEKIKRVDENVEDLQSVVDSVNLKQNALLEKIKEIEANQLKTDSSITLQNQLLQRNNREIQRIKKLQNENTSRIGNYNYSQLDSFFSKRYRLP